MSTICGCLDHGDCDIKLGLETCRETSFISFTQLTQLTVFAVARVWGPHHMGSYAQTYPVMHAIWAKKRSIIYVISTVRGLFNA